MFTFTQACHEFGGQIDRTTGDCVSAPVDGRCPMIGQVKTPDGTCSVAPLMFATLACGNKSVALSQDGEPGCVFLQTYRPYDPEHPGYFALETATCQCPGSVATLHNDIPMSKAP